MHVAAVNTRRTGAHGLREFVAAATRCIVEEEAPAGCEPNASGRQTPTKDLDTASVRPCRRIRRILAVGGNEHGGHGRRAARAAGAAERKCAGRVERDRRCWRSCTALAAFALRADHNSHKRAHTDTQACVRARTEARSHACTHSQTRTHAKTRTHASTHMYTEQLM